MTVAICRTPVDMLTHGESSEDLNLRQKNKNYKHLRISEGEEVSKSTICRKEDTDYPPPDVKTNSIIRTSRVYTHTYTQFE